MTYEPQEMPPEAYANPYAAGLVTMSMICEAARGVLGLIRKRNELRTLNRIDVLPPDWDAAGRHCTRL